jgi:hypothetical protein
MTARSFLQNSRSMRLSAIGLTIGLDQSLVAEQILQRVRKSLGLEQRGAADCAAGADDRIAGAHQNVIAALDRAGAVPEFANEAIAKAFEPRLLGFAEIEVREYPPDGNGKIANQRLFDPTEPAHELRRQAARNAVGQQEVEVLLLENFQDLGLDRHVFVKTRG